MRTGRRFGLLITLMCLALVAAACGDGATTDTDDDGDGEVAVDDGDDGDGDGDGPRHGGTLVKMESGDTPDGLDPHANENVYTHTNVAPMLSKLVDWETGPDAAVGTLGPDLAESWEVSEDGLSYTFNLRDDVVWHDIEPVSGRPFVADDVLATYERMINLPGASAGLFAPVESVDVPDDHTVVFNLSRVHVPFVEDMASHYAWILPREAEQGEYDVANQVIGTGPFMFESWTKDTELVMVRNPDYFVEGKPYLDELRNVIIPDQGARAQALRTGRVDVGFTIDADEAQELVDSGLAMTQYFRAGLQIAFNEDREPFDDPRVIQAVTMAIDFVGMDESIRGGFSQHNAQVAPLAGDFALPEEEVLEARPHDPEAARELLAEAGAEDLSFTLMTSPLYGDVVMREAEWIVQDLGEIGVNVTLENQDFGTFLGRWQGGEQDYDAVIASSASFITADEWLRIATSDHPRNFTSFSNAEYDQRVQEQRELLDEDERREHIWETQRMLLEDYQNPIYPYAYAAHVVHNPAVRDLYPHPAYHGRLYADVWLDE